MTEFTQHDELQQNNVKIYKNLLAHQAQFNFANVPLYWRDQSPIKTFYDNAFSIAVPIFEEYMIQNIKPYINQFNGQLKDDVINFCTQEHNHAINHNHLNSFLKQQNIPVDKFMMKAQKLLSKYQNIPSRKKLQLIALIETFTAVMAKFYLVTAQDEKVDPEVEKLLVWHSIEELEHRRLAYQVHLTINGKHERNPLFILLFCARVGMFLLCSTMKQIIHTKSIWKKRTWTDLPWLINSKGPNLMILKGMFNFMRRGYDPGDYFNEAALNEKVREWESKFHKEGKLINKFEGTTN